MPTTSNYVLIVLIQKLNIIHNTFQSDKYFLNILF